MNTELINRTVDRWNDPERRPLFKGQLVDASGDTPCFCAQGDILHNELGFSIERLINIAQADADKETAKALGISISHAILLRGINDSEEGAPSIVLTNPEKVIGKQAPTVLKFWHRLDAMTGEQWAAAGDAARNAARDAAGDAARNAAWAGAGHASWAADASAAGAGHASWAADASRAADAAWAAARATNEIQGAAIMREREQDFYFLPLFGFNTPEEIE